MKLKMKRLFLYSFILFSVFFGLAQGRELFSNENSSGTTISSLFTPEMLLLSPDLQGTFARNHFWPGLFRDSITEAGIRFEDQQMMNLSIQGNTKVGRCFSGLQLYGFDHNLNNTQSISGNSLKDSTEEERKFNAFSIGGKFYCIPFLFLKNGISAECLYKRVSYNNRTTEWDSIRYSEPYNSNELTQAILIHARGIHRLSRKNFLYADWWMNLNDTVNKSGTGDILSISGKKSSIKIGLLAGISSVSEGNYNWHISAGNESYLRHTQDYYKNTGNAFHTWVVEGALMKEMHFEELTQFTGAQLRLYSILTQQEKEEYRDPGLEFTIPFLLKYSPVSKITFYTGSNVTLTFQHHKAGLYPGNVINTSYNLSPVAIQWTPTNHYSITAIPQINEGVISGSFEWRYRF